MLVFLVSSTGGGDSLFAEDSQNSSNGLSHRLNTDFNISITVEKETKKRIFDTYSNL
jgi:hypothetical protein